MSQMSHLVPKKKRGGNNAKPADTRKIFLAAYEESCGNVSAASAAAGISRRTFYRWLQSPTPINVKFRKRLRPIKPEERLLDLAEAVIIRKLKEGDAATARYVLDRRGGSRGYRSSEIPQEFESRFPVRDPRSEERTLLEKVGDACRACLEEFADQIDSDALRWGIVRRFAVARRVDPKRLADQIGFEIPQDDPTPTSDEPLADLSPGNLID